MTGLRRFGYSICLLLTLMTFTGLVTQPIALAVSTNTASLSLTPPEQKSPEEEITLNTKFPVLSSQTGASGFEFEVDLLRKGGEKPCVFDLRAEVPSGFSYTISRQYGSGTDIAAIQLDPNMLTPEKIKVTVRPFIFLQPEPGEYSVTVEAISEEVKGSINLKAIVNAKYDLGLETPDGLLNTKVTAGKDNYFSVAVKNTGTAELEKINFSSKVRGGPSGWSVTFNPEDIESLPVGGEREVEISIKPPEKTISGDYEITVSAEPESKTASDSLDIRVTVLTPTIWGWVGVIIVVLVVVGLVVMFMRLGRR